MPELRWHATLMGALMSALLVAGCGSPDARNNSGDIHDPYENVNRGVHKFNLGVDKIFFRPAAKSYTKVIPDSIEDSFNHFSTNISEPGDTVNYLFQGRLKDAGISAARFLMNSTIGFGGLADPASEFGLPATDTDFGETLYVWGVGEGPYIELPLLGPSNARDSVGVLVDLFTNPISLTPQNPIENVGIYAEALERLSDRGRFSDTVDSILYESADSYAQARIIYLQNRRFELAGSGGETYLDPYAEATDDPYEDPYAE